MTIKVLATKLRAPTELDSASQLEALNNTMRKAFRKNKKYKALVEELLTLGGAHVILPQEHDVHLDLILDRGKLFTKRGRLPKKLASLCEDNQCHWNSLLLQKQNPKMFDVATGYYLQGDDGLWRSHTWLVGKKDKLVYETTVPAVGYFGAILTPKEVQQFQDMYE